MVCAVLGVRAFRSCAHSDWLSTGGGGRRSGPRCGAHAGVMALDLTRLQRRPDLLALGCTDAQLHRHRRDGELATIRRGAYVSVPDPRLSDPETRHALLVAAAWPTFADGTVLSHCSAAVLLGLPVWAVPLGRVHVTRARPTGGRIG